MNRISNYKRWYNDVFSDNCHTDFLPFCNYMIICYVQTVNRTCFLCSIRNSFTFVTTCVYSSRIRSTALIIMAHTMQHCSLYSNCIRVIDRYHECDLLHKWHVVFDDNFIIRYQMRNYNGYDSMHIVYNLDRIIFGWRAYKRRYRCFASDHYKYFRNEETDLYYNGYNIRYVVCRDLYMFIVFTNIDDVWFVYQYNIVHC